MLGSAALWILPWFAVFAAFLVAYAWIRRDWMWIVGDDQNLMMPAIDIGRGLVPNIDFANGYPGLTFYVQRAIMLVVGDLPISEHVYTALQAAFFAVVAAWALRGRIPAALTWILVFFLWTVSHRLNPTPNPGFAMQALALLSLVWMARFGSSLRLVDALIAGGLAGLAFLFKQPGIFLPVAFFLYSSHGLLAWAPKRPSPARQAAVIAANIVALIAFAVTYLGESVFGVVDDPGMRQSLLFSTVMFLGPWAAAIAGLAIAPGRAPARSRRAWTLGLVVRSNLHFVAGFLAVSAIGFVAIYGSPDRIATALRAVFVEGPQLINGADSKVMQPLLLWPTVTIAVLVIMSPFAIRAVRSWPLQMLVFGATCAGCLYTALTYSDLQFTVAPTLLWVLLVVTFWLRRPEDPEDWNRFFLFLGATCLLAYLVPHPKTTYSLGILAVTGWLMLGAAGSRRWPAALTAVGFAAVVAIAIVTLRWAWNENAGITVYKVGAHTVRSYDSTFPAAVDAASASSLEDWRANTNDYLVYLAHAP